MSDQTIANRAQQQTGAAVPAASDRDGLSSLASGVALTFAARLLILFGSLGSSIIVGRWLGPAGLGALAVLNVTVALALQLGSAGLPSATTYFIAKDRSNLKRAWANAIVFGLAAGVVIASAVVMVARLKPDVFEGVTFRLVSIVAVSIPFQLVTLLGLNVLLAIDRIKSMNLFESLSSLLVLISAVFVLVIWRRNLEMLVSFNAAAAIVVSLILAWFIGRRVLGKEKGSARPDLALLKQLLGYGLKFYVSILAGVVIFRADLLIVNRFRGANEAGVYAVASQFTFLLIMLPGVIASLLFPRVAARQHRAADYTAEVTRHASFVMIIMCLAAAAFSFSLPLVYGARFADATVQLLIMLPGVYFISIESVLVQHFTGTGLPRAIPWFWVITVAVNLALNFALVPAWGARAAAVNSTVSYALIFFLVTAYFCRKTGYGPSALFLLRKSDVHDLFARFRRRAFAG
jgi:O-antigen/teichoic acid export membrane protein